MSLAFSITPVSNPGTTRAYFDVVINENEVRNSPNLSDPSTPLYPQLVRFFDTVRYDRDNTTCFNAGAFGLSGFEVQGWTLVTISRESGSVELSFDKNRGRARPSLDAVTRTLGWVFKVFTDTWIEKQAADAAEHEMRKAGRIEIETANLAEAGIKRARHAIAKEAAKDEEYNRLLDAANARLASVTRAIRDGIVSADGAPTPDFGAQNDDGYYIDADNQPWTCATFVDAATPTLDGETERQLAFWHVTPEEMAAIRETAKARVEDALRTRDVPTGSVLWKPALTP